MLRRFLADEQGATAIEYALIASLISTFILTGLLALSAATQQMYTEIATAVS